MSMDQTRGRVSHRTSITNRLKSAIADRRSSVARQRERIAGPSVKERQQDLIHFYQEYEALVEVLCDAAQYGPTAALEGAYTRQRDWMRENYPRIGAYAVAYMRLEVDDAGDAFEALFAEPDLGTFLDSDDGKMISRIMRTREALNLYGDHLRQLALAA
jgi:hypothetical protein